MTHRSAASFGRLAAARFTLLLALTLACGDGSSSGPTAAPPRLARQPTGAVTVSAAAPDTASQGTTIDVTIAGSGFTSDMIATWQLAGVADPTQVRTNSTRFVSSRQLVANITIAPSATATQWDVAVAVAGGGKDGMGSELFTVKITGSTDTDPRVQVSLDEQVNVAAPGAPVNLQPAGVAADGRDELGATAPVARYWGSFCGVLGKVYMANGGGDLRVDTDFEYSATRMGACGGRRTFHAFLGYQAGRARGTATPFGGAIVARGAGLLGAGETRPQAMGFGDLGVRGCERAQFDPALHAGAAFGRVTRLPDANGVRQWRVESQYPHTAVCMTTQKGALAPTSTLKYLPFAFTATEVPFPYPTYPQ